MGPASDNAGYATNDGQLFVGLGELQWVRRLITPVELNRSAVEIKRASSC
jgi:hypothetical protein